MPSPLGHSLAGLAIGLATSPATDDTGRRSWRLPLAAATMAALPDIDLLLPHFHRMGTHSVGATCLIMIVTAAVTGQVTGRVQWRWVIGLGLAQASHILLDWLGTDHYAPPGLQALWPFSHRFFISGWDLFQPTERRMIPEAVAINARALISELAIMGPIAALSWRLTRTRRSRGRLSAPDAPPRPSV